MAKNILYLSIRCLANLSILKEEYTFYNLIFLNYFINEQIIAF